MATFKNTNIKNPVPQSAYSPQATYKYAASQGKLKLNEVPRGSTLYPIAANAQVLGVKAPPGGGGGGGGYSVPSSSGVPQSYEEQAPSMPEFDYTPYDDAISQLDSQIQELSQQGETDVAQAQESAVKRKGLIEEGLGVQQKGFDVQRADANAANEEAKNELRRQYSEQAQGIQARFGGTTGTGAFATEVLGTSFFQQVGRNTKNLESTGRFIEQARAQAVSEANKLMFENDLKTQELVSNLKSNLNANIAQLRDSQGRIRVERAQQYRSVLDNYRQQLSEINARNANFKQNLYLKQVDFENEMKNRQMSAYKTYKTEQEKIMDKILKVDPRLLTEQGTQQLSQSIGLPQGSLAPLPVDKPTDDLDKLRKALGITTIQ